VPSHHSFTSDQPVAAHDFLMAYTSAISVDPTPEAHLYSNGTCALLKWVQFKGPPQFQLHFVDNWWVLRAIVSGGRVLC
jgi:hypothetical protein